MTVAALKIGTWNILGRIDHETGKVAEPDWVRSILAQHDLDILCLQEVHFYGGDADRQLRHELKEAGLAHFAGLPLSESHLDRSAQLGVAIASRYPLAESDALILTRPALTAWVRGSEWVLHDKGMIGCALDVGWRRPIRVYSLHLFPFFEFGVEDDDARVDDMWREFWAHCDPLVDRVDLVLAGDFNQPKRVRAAQRWSRRGWQFCFAGMTTTPTGLALDEVALSWSDPDSQTALVPTFSDHHLAIAQVQPRRIRDADSTLLAGWHEIGQEREPKGNSTRRPTAAPVSPGKR